MKPLIVLDIDETILYASENKLDIREDHIWENYYIYVRPFFMDLIKAIKEYYHIAIWTSSGEKYSDFIAENYFKDVEIEFKWSRERCTMKFDPWTQEYHFVKNLKKVFRRYPKEKVLMIDDTPMKISYQYGNLICVPEFKGDQADTVLDHLCDYLLTIKDEPNFRRIEKRGWLNKYKQLY